MFSSTPTDRSISWLSVCQRRGSTEWIAAAYLLPAVSASCGWHRVAARENTLSLYDCVLQRERRCAVRNAAAACMNKNQVSIGDIENRVAYAG